VKGRFRGVSPQFFAKMTLQPYAFREDASGAAERECRQDAAGRRMWAHSGLGDCTWRKRVEAKGVTRSNLAMDQCVVNPIAAIAGNDPKAAF
jgi:hypothetical protein